jgi:hypothetical protein
MECTRNKRNASDDPNAHVLKRARMEEEDDSSSPTTDDASNVDYSVESHLSVPLSVIFRHVPNSAHPRPLLTRAEAQCFLQVNFLAHEIDVMVQLSEETLGRQRWCRQLGDELMKYSNSNPYLRPLSTMLTLHHQQQQQTCPRVVASALDRILQSLAGCATTLRQSSEQNWTLSESLLDALEGAIGGGGQVLAQEKKRLAELEEEVCSRVERLLETHQTQNQNSCEKDDMLVVEPPLRTVCNSIWGDDLNLNLNLKEESSSSTLTNKKKETSDAATTTTTTTTVPTTTKVDTMPPPPPQELTTLPAPKDPMPPPPLQESTKYPTAAGPSPPAHKASSFSYPTQNLLSAKTQPEYRKGDNYDDHDDEVEDSDDEHIPDPPQESQNSFLKKSSAAEALAVLAFGRPANNHSL